MQKRKKGRLEKKHWELLLATFPQLRDMVSRYELTFNLVVETEIEEALSSIEDFMDRPRSFGEGSLMLHELIKAFISAAAKRVFPQGPEDHARIYVLSRVANTQILIGLIQGKDSGDGWKQ